MKRIGIVWAGAMAAFLALAVTPAAGYDDDSYSSFDSGDSESSFGSFGSFGSDEPSSAPAASRSGFFQGSSGSGNVINVPGDASSIALAMVSARTGDTVKVRPGVYRERVIIAPGVALVSSELFGAKINGGGRGTVVTMSRGSTVSGFEITGGTVGVFSSDIGNVIVSNRIVNNWMTGIVTVRNLPKIQDNIIAFNRASGIQGWDVRSTAATVNHNSIAFNGNHGIAIGGSSELIIENNVIAFNERLGLKIVEQPEKIQVTSNNFFKNLWQPGKQVPDNNYAFDPAFVAPRSGFNFKLDPGQCCKEKSSDDENLGARLEY